MSGRLGMGRGRRAPRRVWISVAAVLALPSAAAAQPAPPSDLRAEPESASRIDLSWSRSSGPLLSGYRIYRDGALVGVSGDTFYSDTGLQPWTEYTYAVTAVDFFGRESAPTDPVTARTLDETPPSKPGDLRGTAISPFQIDLEWKEATDPESGVAGYVVYRDRDSVATTPVPAYSDTGLQPDTRYEYRVSAVNGAGLEGDRSGRVGIRTPPLAPPPPPTGLSAEAVSPTAIDLRWTAPADGPTPIVGYRVYRDGAFLVETSETLYADTGLQPSTTYEYRVTSVDANGLESDPSDPASATTPREPDTTPPPAPTDLLAQPIGPSRVDLSWSPAEDPESGVSEYLVYRDGMPIGSVPAPGFSDTGLAPSTTYRYGVSAVNGEGLEGERSAEAVVTTPAPPDTTPPTAPTDLVAHALSQNRIELVWTEATDPESGVASYRVYRDGGPAGSTTGTGFVDTGLTADTRYAYAVAAVNGEGLEGPRSEAVAESTFPPPEKIPPAPPTGLRVVGP